VTPNRVLRRESTPERTHLWVAPPFDGPPTGGTLYNAALARALSERGARCLRIDVGDAMARLLSPVEYAYWVDSLYLAAVPELARANVHRAPMRLVVHYLPSLVSRGDGAERSRAERDERAALEIVDGCLVTSAYMARCLTAGGVPADRIVVVEPAVPAWLPTDVDPPPSSEVRALLVANLSPAKGLLELIGTLAESMISASDLRLTVVGSLEMDADYSEACRRFVDGVAALRTSVDLVGPLPHEGVLRRMMGSDVVVSASAMESYGMVLAEARALGLPILALRGGNVDSHVGPESGGALFPDIGALVRDLIRLARDRNELRRRQGLARSARRTRSWDEAAVEFLSTFGADRAGDGDA